MFEPVGVTCYRSSAASAARSGDVGGVLHPYNYCGGCISIATAANLLASVLRMRRLHLQDPDATMPHWTQVFARSAFCAAYAAMGRPTQTASET